MACLAEEDSRKDDVLPVDGPSLLIMLHRRGANCRVKDKQGRSALALAADYGAASHVDVLLEFGLDIDEKTDAGLTPLLLAARAGEEDTVEKLIECGADETIKDRKGRTAREILLDGGAQSDESEGVIDESDPD